MSSVNVIPSAPEYTETLYPSNEITQINAEDFRLKKISDLQTELKNEADHYRQVAKKYKRTHNITHISAVGLGSLSAGLSSATLETALTGFGIVASPALAGVATVFGLLSAGFTVASKRLERKVTKHEKIYSLALAKLNSVAELVRRHLQTRESAIQNSQSFFVKLKNTTNSKPQSGMALKTQQRKKHKYNRLILTK